MNKQLETKWVVFLFGLLLTVFGLLTGFRLNESLDLQVHDTYFVIHSTQLLVLPGLTLMAAYLLTLGLKHLAALSSALKMTSVLITGLVGLCLVGMVILMIIALVEIPQNAQFIPNYGILLLLIGLGVLFVLRTIETLKIE